MRIHTEYLLTPFNRVALNWKRRIKKERPLARTALMKGGVVPPGIEPGTQGFSVLCSTN